MREYVKSLSVPSLMKAIERWRRACTWCRNQATTGKWSHGWRYSIASLEDALEIARQECSRRGIPFPREEL